MLGKLFDIQNLLAASALLVAIQVMLLSTSPAAAEVGSAQVARLLETTRSNGRRRTR